VREGQGTPIYENSMYYSLFDPYMTTRDRLLTEGVLLHPTCKTLVWEGQGTHLGGFKNPSPTFYPTLFNLRFFRRFL